LEEQRHDERNQLRLEEHVTLEGTIRFASQLTKDLFGVLFDVYRDDSLVGSFYLDPFRRPGKPKQRDGGSGHMTTLLLNKTTEQTPVAVVCTNFKSPTWDDDPAMLQWDDVTILLHELGHVIDHFVGDRWGQWPTLTSLGLDPTLSAREELLSTVCIVRSFFTIAD
jgi:hypothetical protein